jgi:hypothetical protein
MRRIAVVGAAAPASPPWPALGDARGLPVVHPDAHYYGPGWRPPAPADWAARHRRLAAGDRWVLDGNYTRPKLDRWFLAQLPPP